MSMDTMTPEQRADLRVEIVKREINQGALAGLDITISDYAAQLVIAALDSFDAHVEQQAYAAGFRQGVEFQKARSASMPQPQPQPPQSVFGRDEPPYPHGER